MTNSLRALLILLLLLALAIPAWHAPAVEPMKLEKLAVQHLPNAIRVHPRVISGGLPEGDVAFAELRDLGVRTVISVDGMAPDIKTAKRYGLRYVHLPHGYDGIPAARIEDIATAVQTLPGPIYIHCHHGKHRSPAASAAACVSAGLIEPEESAAILKLAGTSPHYTGLYHDVAAARRMTIQKMSASFPEQSPVPQLVARMVQLEHWQAILTAASKSPPAKAATDQAHHRENPAATALLLREQFTELLRDTSNKQRPEYYVQLLQESETAAERLESFLKREDTDLTIPVQREEAAKLLVEVSARCTTCHKAYRDPAGSR